MDEYPDNKFKIMVDEMNRFEEEIGLPYVPEMSNQKASAVQPFVIDTSTFSQAQQKIQQGDVMPGPEAMFMPGQGGIPPPPPPPPPMLGPPSGLPFPPGLAVPYTQPIPPPPQPPSFPPSIVRNDSVPAPPVMPSTSIPFARRPPQSWAPRSTFRPSVVTANESKVTKPETKSTDSAPKVVLSATPKLYTSKPVLSSTSTIAKNSSISSFMDVEPSKSLTSSELAKFNKEKYKFTTAANTNSNSGSSSSIMNNSSNNTVNKSIMIPSASTIQDGYAVLANKQKEKKQKKFIRVSGGQTWEDQTLKEWEDGDFRLFCGDLGNDVTDELLTRIFSKYPSFLKARVVRDKRTNKTKGFGFISFKDPQDFIRASKEMNGRYVGSRPIKLRKSTWKNRNLDSVKKKEKEKAQLIAMLTGK